MKCEILGCENEATGCYLDDFETCQDCYEKAIERDSQLYDIDRVEIRKEGEE